MSDEGYKYPILDSNEISCLAESCPKLEELRLQVRRSRGCPAECALYKAIGGFTKLHSLILDMHCDPRRLPTRPYLKFVPDLRETFINAATDKALVSAIWKYIFSNQATRRLRNLRCVPFGANFFPEKERHVIERLSLNFLARGPDYDTFEPLEVVELGERERLCLREEAREPVDESVEIPDKIQNVLDDLWPPPSGEGDQH